MVKTCKDELLNALSLAHLSPAAIYATHGHSSCSILDCDVWDAVGEQLWVMMHPWPLSDASSTSHTALLDLAGLPTLGHRAVQTLRHRPRHIPHSFLLMHDHQVARRVSRLAHTEDGNRRYRRTLKPTRSISQLRHLQPTP